MGGPAISKLATRPKSKTAVYGLENERIFAQSCIEFLVLVIELEDSRYLTNGILAFSATGAGSSRVGGVGPRPRVAQAAIDDGAPPEIGHWEASLTTIGMEPENSKTLQEQLREAQLQVEAAERRLEAAEREQHREREQREAAERKREAAEQQTQPTTLDEYFDACHELVFAKFHVEQNPGLVSQGSLTNPQSKWCPTKLQP
ncbi:hypothetical protein Purlil1_12964 [Purpureocillium lilacinum]|uniref:Uncharacterized protein n=1 Tax=Purpureocillium lilacinum TaxID=33203 RepID=A0ABR0BFS1_PURLI|nr:hypothetical protein Purlil1_12964 [Purpureocillium lilacinum]